MKQVLCVNLFFFFLLLEELLQPQPSEEFFRIVLEFLPFSYDMGWGRRRALSTADLFLLHLKRTRRGSPEWWMLQGCYSSLSNKFLSFEFVVYVFFSADIVLFLYEYLVGGAFNFYYVVPVDGNRFWRRPVWRSL